MSEQDYPSNEELTKIASWKIASQNDFINLMEYVRGLWKYADNGYWTQKGNVFFISTAGWSGNEDIIITLQGNTDFWMFYWRQSRRGGHYIFGNTGDFITLMEKGE